MEHVQPSESIESDCYEPPAEVFEVIDSTDEDMYFPVGMFLSQLDANLAIDKHFEIRGVPPNESFHNDVEAIKLEIRSRPIGLGDAKKIQTRQWSLEYVEDVDDSVWIECS